MCIKFTFFSVRTVGNRFLSSKKVYHERFRLFEMDRYKKPSHCNSTSSDCATHGVFTSTSSSIL